MRLLPASTHDPVGALPSLLYILNAAFPFEQLAVEVNDVQTVLAPSKASFSVSEMNPPAEVSALTGPVYEASLTAADAELDVLNVTFVFTNHFRPLASVNATLPVAAVETPGCLAGLTTPAARLSEPLSETETAAMEALP